MFGFEKMGFDLFTRFPLRLVKNFGHSTGRPVLITDQPYMFIYSPTVAKIPHWADKNRAQIY